MRKQIVDRGAFGWLYHKLLEIAWDEKNSDDNELYRIYFNDLKENGIFLNASYDDNEWVCFKDKDTATVTLSFTYMAYPEINIIVKNYILTKLYLQNSSFITLKKRLLAIRHFMQDTDFMNPDNINDYQLLLKTWNGNKKREVIALKEFLLFSNLPNADLYCDILKDISKSERTHGDLPEFKGILIFDYMVNDYWNQQQILDDKEKYKLFPVILWWKITTIIPTRPHELFNLKRDCIYKDNGKYFFQLEREKTHLDKQFINGDIITDFEINEELYYLIKDYVTCCNQIDNCKYLISPPTCDMTYKDKVFNTREKFTHEKFKIYYKAFLKEVVEKQYHYKVVKNDDVKEVEIPYIYLGDTRHLTILNMMQQGVNPIYIAQISRHHTLDVQLGYYSYLETFTTSKTYMLNQFMKKIIT